MDRFTSFDVIMSSNSWIFQRNANCINLSPQSKKYLRCFVTAVFRRPYRCFSIDLKVILSLSDRYKLFTNYELKFVKMQFLGKSISLWQQWTKNFEVDKIRILRSLNFIRLLRVVNYSLSSCWEEKTTRSNRMNFRLNFARTRPATETPTPGTYSVVFRK